MSLSCDNLNHKEASGLSSSGPSLGGPKLRACYTADVLRPGVFTRVKYEIEQSKMKERRSQCTKESVCKGASGPSVKWTQQVDKAPLGAIWHALFPIASITSGAPGLCFMTILRN